MASVLQNKSMNPNRTRSKFAPANPNRTRRNKLGSNAIIAPSLAPVTPLNPKPEPLVKPEQEPEPEPEAPVADSSVPPEQEPEQEPEPEAPVAASSVPSVPSVPPEPVSSATSATNDANAPKPNCMIYPSLFSSADPECYVPVAVPQLYQIAEAAIHKPLDDLAAGGAQLVVAALEATGNDALVELAKAKALTPEQAALLNKVSDDPQVAEELKKFQDKLASAVSQGINTASETVTKPAEEAVGRFTTGAADTVLTAVADIPMVGLGMSAATAIQTGIQAVEDATDIKTKLEAAAAPVTQAMDQVGDLTNAINNAASNAEGAATNAVSSAEGVASNAEGVASSAEGAANEGAATNAVSNAEGVASNAEGVASNAEGAVSNAEGAVSNAEGAVSSAEGEASSVASNVASNAVSNAANEGMRGGSRKRRHIHKLSRRIERTLRRVQKKYGLKDKNDFLRRTLRRGTYVPQGT